MASGIKPLPDIEQKIKHLIDKNHAASINIDDIEFEEQDSLSIEILNKATPISIACYRGNVTSRVMLHHQKMLHTQVGSPLAIDNAYRNLLHMEDDE